MKKFIGLSVMVCLLLADSPARGGLIFSASLRNGDYGGGATQNTMAPDHGGSPGVLGIVDSTEGVTFTATESTNRSNAVIYWQPGANRNSFRTHGTVSMWMYFDHEAHSAMTSWGHTWCENFGWTEYRNGMASFSGSSQHVANGPGEDDDEVNIGWTTLHGSTWYNAGSTRLEYDRWYNVGFTWGGPDNDYELWVNGVLASSFDLPGGVSLPWGVTWAPSGTNWGLGGLHERGIGLYGSSVGVTYADLQIWDEYRASAETVPEPTTALLLATGFLGLTRVLRRKRT